MRAARFDGFSLRLVGDVLRLIPLCETQPRSQDVKARRTLSRMERRALPALVGKPGERRFERIVVLVRADSRRLLHIKR